MGQNPRVVVMSALEAQVERLAAYKGKIDKGIELKKAPTKCPVSLSWKSFKANVIGKSSWFE